MLESIRKRKSSLISSFIILAVVAVMAFYGFGSPDMGGSSGGAAAWVNGEVITNQEFQRELEFKVEQFQTVFGAQYDEKFLDELQIPQRTLDELIQFKLLAQQARRLDILVPDLELAEYIRSIPYYQKDGKFDAELYRSIPNVGLQETRQRERLMWSKLQTYLTDRVHLTPAALRAAYELRETKVDLKYAKIDFSEMGTKRTPPKAEMARLKQTVTPAEVEAYYNNHKEDYSEPAAVKLRQIRVGIPYQASAEKRAEAKKKIEELASTVTAANFSEMAKKHSDDEFARKGGEAGWINRGTLEEPLENALDRLEPGTVSASVETSFGYFLLLVDEKREEKVQPMESVRDDITQKVALEKYRKDYTEDLRQKWEKMVAEGKPLDAELKKVGISVAKTGPFSLGQGYIPNVGQSEALMDAVFALSPQKRVSDKLHYHQNDYYYLVLDSVQRPKAEDFGKQRDVIERSMETALQSALMSQWVASLRKNSTVEATLQFSSTAVGATGE